MNFCPFLSVGASAQVEGLPPFLALWEGAGRVSLSLIIPSQWGAPACVESFPGWVVVKPEHSAAENSCCGLLGPASSLPATLRDMQPGSQRLDNLGGRLCLSNQFPP